MGVLTPLTRVLLVASPGGHLDELRYLCGPLGLSGTNNFWATSRTTQTEALLKSERVRWLDPIKSSETTKSLRAFPAAVALHRQLQPDLVVSTGAALAAPHLLAASLFRSPIVFIESAARTNGPSRVGSMVQRLPGARLVAQGDGWGDPRWGLIPSVFDVFRSVERPGPTPLPATVAVSLGSEKFPFVRAVNGVRRALEGSDALVHWQVGSTPIDGLRQWVDPAALRSKFRESDVVITHAGVGSLLASLSCGRVPIVLTRRAKYGEHIDDHQVQIAERLAAKGLVIHVDPERLCMGDFLNAASRKVERI